MNKTETHGCEQQFIAYWRERDWGDLDKGKGSQVYGDGKKFNIGW